MRPVGTVALAAFAWVVGCGDDPVDLTVDVRTDWRPGAEFSAIDTEISPEPFDGAAPIGTRTITEEVDPSADYFLGERVAELDDLTMGRWFVRMTLRDAGGVGIARRVVDVQLDESFALTVVLTRNCREITCPGAGDAPELTACFDARCVDPRCSTSSPEFCGEPSCQADAECEATGCARARCIAGACLCGDPPIPDAGPSCDPMACDDGNPCTDGRCDPVEGCVHDPNTDTCDDGDACTMGDVCTAGTCTAGAAVTCDDGDPCTDDACDTTMGCTTTPRAEHSTCGAANMRCCGGSCVDIRTDRNHCSGCGQQCATGRACIIYDGEPTCDCVANSECHGGVGQLCSTTYDLTCACTSDSGCVEGQRCIDRPTTTNNCTY